MTDSQNKNILEFSLLDEHLVKRAELIGMKCFNIWVGGTNVKDDRKEVIADYSPASIVDKYAEMYNLEDGTIVCVSDLHYNKIRKFKINKKVVLLYSSKEIDEMAEKNKKEELKKAEHMIKLYVELGYSQEDAEVIKNLYPTLYPKS